MVLEREYLGMGLETHAFEQELSTYIGGGRSVACVSTGTAALQLAVQGCGIGPGDEVLVPSLTFVACFQAILATGATPVACDANLSTATIDLADTARRITSRSRAIMPMHYAGFLPNVGAIYELARAKGLRVIEDAAHAFGGSCDGAKIGSKGDVICFSFDGIKNITCGEGGAVVTADARVRQIVEDARLLGVQRDTDARYRGERSWDYDVCRPGWRYHMSNVMAAIGRAQLARLDIEFAPRRVALARRYRTGLANLSGVALLDTDLGAVVPHIQPIRILGGRRDAVQAALRKHGIETGLHYKPNHLLTLFRTPQAEFPASEQLYRELLTLPLHVELTDSDVDMVIEELTNAVRLLV